MGRQDKTKETDPIHLGRPLDKASYNSDSEEYKKGEGV